MMFTYSCADYFAKAIKRQTKWDRRFLELAKTFATFSKDDSTKVGAVIIRDDLNLVSSGFNGLPRGVSDDVPDRRSRPEKYYWAEHAERNAIYSAAKIGVSVEGCTMYSTLCPCADCARGIIQSGIKRVVIPVDADTGNDKWQQHFMRSVRMFREAGVELDHVS